MQSGQAGQRSDDYVRHGTTRLFAALEIAAGQVNGVCKQRHRHQEFLAFLKHVARTYAERDLHLVVDNYAAPQAGRGGRLADREPRIHVHFSPTSGSWLNLVGVWFGIIERQAVRRGTFRSVHDLTTKIRAFINGWNTRKHPFIWTKTADEVLTKINLGKTSTASH